MDETRLDEGVLSLLASFYLLDFDYPRYHKIGLIILEDINVPQDIAGPFQYIANNYRKFKSDLQ